MSEHIRTELADGVLTVTLNRPDKKNALTQAMYTGLAEAAERARTDDAVRVLLFRAEGDSSAPGTIFRISSAWARKPRRRPTCRCSGS